MGLDQGALAWMIMIAVIVAAASYVACIGAAGLAGRAIYRINYRLLCLVVLAFLLAMSYAFTGIFGLFIYSSSPPWWG